MKLLFLNVYNYNILISSKSSFDIPKLQFLDFDAQFSDIIVLIIILSTMRLVLGFLLNNQITQSLDFFFLLSSNLHLLLFFSLNLFNLLLSFSNKLQHLLVFFSNLLIFSNNLSNSLFFFNQSLAIISNHICQIFIFFLKYLFQDIFNIFLTYLLTFHFWKNIVNIDCYFFLSNNFAIIKIPILNFLRIFQLRITYRRKFQSLKVNYLQKNNQMLGIKTNKLVRLLQLKSQYLTLIMRFILLKFFNNLKNQDFIKVNIAHHQSNYLQILQMIDLKQKNNNINYFFQKCKVNKKIKQIIKIFQKSTLKLKTKVYQRMLTDKATFLLKNNIQFAQTQDYCSKRLDYCSKRLVY
ncbi:transmembrane protein, putative (macronuclear) [Tetrahymena thermophila SB210]|uniref:Transmembrane protein, putative n=1 Tax=Tetrahymena thermophila (strain SB210) TaxID=312017 RepID=W7XE25_TETTS|nr:transmembrane protein, putative [Tetrahymena thermophila SB210]EWS75897.1 transmembrane protein, putative [Tetrahymena thermophila SB210]|eukprot:XP_012651568.1 transmembrane protein, putative [Tetrahymena thermophila SB210]